MKRRGVTKIMKIIIGAGIYGLYAALYLGQRCTDRIIVLEYDSGPFKRATYVNQARVHMGYHYPRSLSTAKKSAHYFNRFMEDYGFSVFTNFKQVYATSRDFSWTDAGEFVKFCEDASIECVRIDPEEYFNPNMCDGAFFTREYTYDANILRDYFLEKISEYPNIDIIYQVRLKNVHWGEVYQIETNKGNFDADFVLNATYASTNQIAKLFGVQTFKIKYELCEIILCEADKKLKDVGITVMDGPFFSIMPFGKTGLHSLTSVTFTPHTTSYETLPEFDCQKRGRDGYCSKAQLGNCNGCKYEPKTAWPYMSKLAKKYLKEDYKFKYLKSLYSVKPILMASEVDDSRPTVIKTFSEEPLFVSVLSGKINTVYDLDNVLNEVLRRG